MRTVTKTVTLYQFDELSPAAQEKAREWYREEDFYPWCVEFRQSLDGFLSMAGIKLRGWEYDINGYNYTLSDSQFDDNVENFDTRRLISYCHARFDKYLTRAKRYAKDGLTWDKSKKVRK